MNSKQVMNRKKVTNRKKVMNRKHILLLLLVVILSITGCSGGANVTPEPQEDPSLTSVKAFLTQEPSAAAIGSYIRSPEIPIIVEAGDLLLERLLLAQEDTVNTINRKIFDEAYMKALNETMGGVLDPSKIKDITDEAVRRDYQEAADGFLKVVRYEETPVLEPDWAVIATYNIIFSDESKEMIDLRSRLQGRYYYEDSDLLASDIVITESKIKGAKQPFVRWQLKKLYKHQVSVLLIGPEGSYLSEYVSGDAAAMARITNYASAYQDSNLSRIAEKILAKSDINMMALSDLIQSSLAFPPGDARVMADKESVSGETKLRILELSNFEDQALADKLNQEIEKAAAAMIKPGIKGQSVTAFLSFANNNYLGLNLANSYEDPQGNYQFQESFLTLDMATGNPISLDDLVGAPFESYVDRLMAVMRAQNPQNELVALDPPVNFLVNDWGLQILIPRTDGNGSDYYGVSLNGLRAIMDVTRLY